MKKSILMMVMFFIVVAMPMVAQLKVTVNLSSRPDPYLSTWSTRKEIVILTIINSGSNSVRGKFDCKINQNGQLVANTKPEKMRILDIPTGVSQYYGEDLVPFENVKIKDGLDRTAVQTGMLPAGSYEFCCSILDETNRQISPPVCKNFTLQSYQAPVLLQPEDKAELANGKRPMFRWTPVSPKPNFFITYQIRVFEVLPGQTAINAFRVNKPILERGDIPVTQFQWPADFDLPNPKLEHIWTVRAIDDKGNTIGEPDGYATPFTYKTGVRTGGERVVSESDNGSPNAKEKGKDSTKKDRDFKPMGEHIPEAQLRGKKLQDSLIEFDSGTSNENVNAKEKGKDSTKKDRDFKPMGEHIPEAQLRTNNTKDSVVNSNQDSDLPDTRGGQHIADVTGIHKKKKSSSHNFNDNTETESSDTTQNTRGGKHIPDAFGKKPNKKKAFNNSDNNTETESSDTSQNTRGGEHIAEWDGKKKKKKSYEEYEESAKTEYEAYIALAKKGYDYYQASAKKGYDAYAAKGKKGYSAYAAKAKKEYDEYTANAKRGYDYYKASSRKGYEYYMSKYPEDNHAESKKSYDMYSALAAEQFETYSKLSKKSYDAYSALANEK